MTIRVNDLKAERAVAYDAFVAAVGKKDKTDAERAALPALKKKVEDIDSDIGMAVEAQRMAASTARPVEGQDPQDNDTGTSVQVRERDPYTNEDDAKAMGFKTHLGLRAIACAKLFDASGKDLERAHNIAVGIYGPRHPISRAFIAQRDPKTRALVTGAGASGGYIVPPDYVAEIIELLRPKAVIRAAGPRVLPMPRGTMTLPGQNSGATAGYGSEVAKIASSQQTLKQITASFKKLTAITPVSNDMMRYADPAADAFVRDDLVKVIGLREDLAFILGDGTADAPKGFLFFANDWIAANKGTIGNWSTTGNSTMAVNATDPANSTGGNFVTSTASYTLATVANELGGAVNRLDQANVPDDRRVWFMNPRSYNYLFNVQNSLGVYVYREELLTGKLLGYPFKKTTQIGTNYWDATGTNKDLSFVFLAEMDETMILDSMSLELAVSREGTYVDGTGTTVSAFQNDQTIIRAIAEHDFQLRHLQSVAVIQGTRWAPAIS